MVTTTLQRVTRRFSKLALGLPIVLLTIAPSIGNAQTVYQITDYSGNVLPAASGLYTVVWNCYNQGGPPMPAAICSWYVRRLYGTNYPVVVVNDYPHATPPGCQYGITSQIDPGYTRSNCGVFATAAVYGIN
ncbi:MAG TPA: hypothetical protein VM146_05975 [Steroidobacteraceae bacterium]|nr:hypothetical protein [Steroidobacteraceae bacterium]